MSTITVLLHFSLLRIPRVASCNLTLTWSIGRTYLVEQDVISCVPEVDGQKP